MKVTFYLLLTSALLGSQAFGAPIPERTTATVSANTPPRSTSHLDGVIDADGGPYLYKREQNKSVSALDGLLQADGGPYLYKRTDEIEAASSKLEKRQFSPIMKQGYMPPPIMKQGYMPPPIVKQPILPPPIMKQGYLPPPIMKQGYMPPPIMRQGFMPPMGYPYRSYNPYMYPRMWKRSDESLEKRSVNEQSAKLEKRYSLSGLLRNHNDPNDYNPWTNPFYRPGFNPQLSVVRTGMPGPVAPGIVTPPMPAPAPLGPVMNPAMAPPVTPPVPIPPVSAPVAFAPPIMPAPQVPMMGGPVMPGIVPGMVARQGLFKN